MRRLSIWMRIFIWWDWDQFPEFWNSMFKERPTWEVSRDWSVLLSITLRQDGEGYVLFVTGSDGLQPVTFLLVF